MRWLMLAFLISVVALLAAAGGMAYHIWRERGRRRELGLATGKVEEPGDRGSAMTNEFPTHAATASQSVSVLEAASRQVIAWMRHICSWSFAAASSWPSALISPCPSTFAGASLAAGLRGHGHRPVPSPRGWPCSPCWPTWSKAPPACLCLRPPHGTTGIAHILGPTGGYLMAYPTMAAVDLLPLADRRAILPRRAGQRGSGKLDPAHARRALAWPHNSHLSSGRIGRGA